MNTTILALSVLFAYALIVWFERRRMNRYAQDLTAAFDRAMAELAKQDTAADQLADALSRLLSAVIPVVPITDDVDGAINGGLAALNRHGYDGELSAARSALEQAEGQVDTYSTVLQALVDALADPAREGLVSALTDAQALLATRPAAWVTQ